MSKIHSKDTKPEVLFRNALFKRGFRYRKNVKSLSGSPDIVLTLYKTVIFIHGCFWHGHKNCKKSKLPETRKEFWEKKINGNIKRDKRNLKDLKKEGWKVIVIWQCQISNRKKLMYKLDYVSNRLN